MEKVFPLKDPLKVHLSKLIDLRDCKNPQFSSIIEEMEDIVWKLQSKLARIVLRVFNKMDLVGLHWSRRWEYPWVVLNADLAPAQTVLDAGCGGSPLLPYFARRGIICYGVDNWDGRPPYLGGWKGWVLQKIGCKPLWGYYPNFALKNQKIAICNESIDDLSFENDFFDRVFCISVIEHLEHRRRCKAAEELARVLKPGGLLIITMDLIPWENLKAYENVVQASRLRLLGEPDFSVGRDIRHGHTYDVVGLILKK